MNPSFVAAALLQVSSSVPPGINVTDRVQTYAITGTTLAALQKQLNALGPTPAADGGRFAASTKWNLQWHFDYARDDSGCRIASSQVELTTVMTLPAWADAAQASPQLQRRWGEFLTHLRAHEDGHREHGLIAARAVRHVIDHVGRAMDCQTLATQVDAFAHAAIAEQSWADRDYDARTRHGQTQGAQL